jgi:UDP-2-acetamido-3-amino-2,3-dideoxy-glucuronate N-acetyltransferase
MKGFFIHPTALVATHAIGEGTRIWAFTNVEENVVVGVHCNIGDHCFVEAGALIGDRVTIKNGNMIWNGIKLEHGVFVGPGVIFTNDRYPRSPRLPEASQRYRNMGWLERTVVRQGASIGGGAVIVAGVELGAFSMVGAGAIVTRDVPAHALVQGVPARRVGWVCK